MGRVEGAIALGPGTGTGRDGQELMVMATFNGRVRVWALSPKPRF